MVPIALYGAVILKNYVALIMALLSMVNFVMKDSDVSTILYIELLLIISFYLSIKSSKNERLKNDVKSFRDESVIKADEIARKNTELIQAKDDEVYFGRLKERNRIAREIHDNVGHMLTRAILQLGALITICRDDVLKSGLLELKSTLDTAMNNIRNSVHDLRDEAIDIPTAIEEIAAPLKENRNLKLEIDISHDVDKEVKYAIIGVVKEAVSNIIKHSNNKNVDHSGKEAVKFYDEYQPDILLMDIRMEEMSGLEAGEIIIGKHEDAKILFLTTFNDDEYIVKALSIGAKGYIIKQEYEIVELVAQGLSNKECADKLCLSEGTVRNYISTILSKLDLRDRTNLAIFYYKS